MPLKKSLYAYPDYIAPLKELIEDAGRGCKQKLARHLKCVPGFLTQVLSKESNFSPEQALGATEYFKLSEEESRAFVLLVMIARANTEKLRRHFRRELEIALKDKSVINHRKEGEKGISKEDLIVYFSSWKIQAIHFAARYPNLRTPESISSYLGIPVNEVNSFLGFLVARRLVEERAGQYYTLDDHFSNSVHDHPDIIALAQRNSRYRGISAHESGKPFEICYSSLLSCTKSEIEPIRELIKETLANVKKIARPAKLEEMYHLSVDLFSMRADP